MRAADEKTQTMNGGHRKFFLFDSLPMKRNRPQKRGDRLNRDSAQPLAPAKTMRGITFFLAVLAFSIPALAQIETVPTFTVTTNDVDQSTIMIFRMGTTNATVKFAFTDTGAKRLEDFYRAHSVGQDVRYRVGRFERVFRLDDRKHFGREGFWGLPTPDSRALEDGLRGRK
jgi:hypothetical protein